MNTEKYKNDGWGLSEKCFEQTFNAIKTFKTPVNVVEFGSGISTEFLVDLINEGYDLNIVSYDNDSRYSTKIAHPKLSLHITDLIECSAADFENQFLEKKNDGNLFFKKTSPVNTRQLYTFYDVNDQHLPDTIDLMIVDGPHGNGRSIAFLHGIGRLKAGSYVVIDDYNHCDFVQKFMAVYESSIEVFKWTEPKDRFVIFKLL